jgi:hypothetical protein
VNLPRQFDRGETFGGISRHPEGTVFPVFGECLDGPHTAIHPPTINQTAHIGLSRWNGKRIHTLILSTKPSPR